MSSELRQRTAAATAKAEETIDAQAVAVDEPPRPWYTALTVRVVLVLLALFFLMHLFLWKVVYDFAMDTNHEQLRGSVRQAIDSLYVFLDHL